MISGVIKLFDDDVRRKKRASNSHLKYAIDSVEQKRNVEKIDDQQSSSYQNSDKHDEDTEIVLGNLPDSRVLCANSQGVYVKVDMRLKSSEIETTMANKREEDGKSSEGPCVHKQSVNGIPGSGFECPKTCSTVIEEYKLTRMPTIRQNFDRAKIPDLSNQKKPDVEIESDNSTDEDEHVSSLSRGKLNVSKLKSKFERNQSVRRSNIFSSSSSDSNDEKPTTNKPMRKETQKHPETPQLNNDTYFSSEASTPVSDVSEEKYEEEFETNVESYTQTSSCNSSNGSSPLNTLLSIGSSEGDSAENTNNRLMANSDSQGNTSKQDSDKLSAIEFNEVNLRLSKSLPKRSSKLTDRSSSENNLGQSATRVQRRTYLQLKEHLNGGSLQGIAPKSKCLDIINELIETERSYVESLKCVVEDYIPEMNRKDITPGLRGQKFCIFGNVEKIYLFHRNIFLVDLENCVSNWMDIGKCFMNHEKSFDMYWLYNKNKPKSDECMKDYGLFFEEKRVALGHSLNLSSQLLKPVQRLARYSLLLQKLQEECDAINESCKDIQKAKAMITFQLRHGDDLLVMDGIKNCDVNLNEQGKLLRQEEFLLHEENGRKSPRRIFLFEELILLSIPSRISSTDFLCSTSMKMTDVGLTDYGDATKFIIWFRKYQFQKYTLQAYSPEVKNAWVKEVTNILMKQAESYKSTKEAELAEMGIYSQTRIPIEGEETDEDERTSNKQYYSMRSLRGVAGEIKPKKVIERTTWYCTIRSDESDS